MTRIADVVAAVAAEFDVTPAEITGPERGDNVVIRARVICYLLAHEITGRSWGVVGHVLGRTKEAAFIGAKSARARLERDGALRGTADRVRARFAS